MLAPQTTATTTWPIPGDVPDIEAIITDQAAAIADQAALIDAYQGALNAAQNLPPGIAAVGNGSTTGSSTSLVVTGVTSANIVTGATVTGTGVPAGVTILGQISGTAGSSGTYLTSAALTIATAIPLTFTPPPLPSSWPTPTDAPTLMLIQQQQTAVLRMQSSLIQAYQDLLNLSQTAAPPTGP